MKYYVTFKLEARYTVEVAAESLDEALVRANKKYIDANFGDAYDIDGEAIVAENEAGDYIWEK